MKLFEILKSFQSAKEKHNEIIRDKIEKLSDDKERIDDLIRAVKEKLHYSASQTEIKTLSQQVKQLNTRKSFLSARIAESGPIRTPILFENGQSFRSKADTDSGNKRTVFAMAPE